MIDVREPDLVAAAALDYLGAGLARVVAAADGPRRNSISGISHQARHAAVSPAKVVEDNCLSAPTSPGNVTKPSTCLAYQRLTLTGNDWRMRAGGWALKLVRRCYRVLP
jgi:hypothetical protein